MRDAGAIEPDPEPPPASLAADDDRLRMVCVRPPGPFKAFDARLTLIASRLSKLLQVTIVRGRETAAESEWLGFVSSTLPTVLLIRAGRVVMKCIGDVPFRELDEMASAAASGPAD